MDQGEKINVKKEILYDDRGLTLAKIYYYENGIKTYRKYLYTDETKKESGNISEIVFNTEKFRIILTVDKKWDNWQVEKVDMHFIADCSFDALKMEFDTEAEKQSFITDFLEKQGYYKYGEVIQLALGDDHILDKVMEKMLKKKGA